MQNMANPFLGVYQTQIEASRRFLDTIFSSTEKIDQVVRGAAQRAVNDQLNFAAAFTQAKDPASVNAAWQSGMASRNSDQAVNTQRELIRIVVEMQSELGKGMQDYVEQLRTRTVSGISQQDSAFMSQPATDSAANPLHSLFSAWQNAFKEASSLAQRNMSTVSSAFTEAASTAAPETSRYVDGTAGAADAGLNAVSAAAEPFGAASTPDAERKAASAAGTSSGKKK